jgi:hypothetical protein
MTKLDFSKEPVPDPARVRSVEDFSLSDPLLRKSKGKRVFSAFGDAMKARRRSEIEAAGTALSQMDVLHALGTPEKEMRPRRVEKVVKRLVGQHVLLPDGSPNSDHPDIIDMMAGRRRIIPTRF